ncbi:glycosyltransferase family 4 protein [Roseobacter sp. HKCCA2468]|uniref:glycosyltransferase family 4 protein n=1 Tax=Roseobacter sp. HKCCA2468 TaxID=3120342 RepID=UPI0030EDBD62
MNKKTVLLAYPHHFSNMLGGGALRMHKIAEMLQASGDYEVHYFASSYNNDLETNYYVHCYFDPDVRSTSGRMSLSFAIKYAIELQRFLKKRPRFDYVVASNTPWLHLLPIYLGGLRKQTILELWEYWGKQWFKNYSFFIGVIGMFLEWLIVQTVGSVSTISKQTELCLKTTRKKVYFNPNGIDNNTIQTVSPSTEFFDAIYFGRLVDYKNIDKFLQAIPIILKTRPDFQFIIIGNGREQSKLISLADELKIRHAVTFKDGEISPVQAYAAMKNAGIFILLTESEGGASIALHEANRCGLPALIIEHPAAIDTYFYEKDLTAIVTPSLSPEDVAATTLWFFTRHTRDTDREKIIDHASEYSWDKVGAQIISIMERQK